MSPRARCSSASSNGSLIVALTPNAPPWMSH